MDKIVIFDAVIFVILIASQIVLVGYSLAILIQELFELFKKR